MKRTRWTAPLAAGLIAAAGLVASMAIAEQGDAAKPAAEKPAAGKPAADKPEMQPPPGWTKEQMEACIKAGTPGKQHEHLAKGLGTWQGKNTMWMTPEAEPMTADCTFKVTSLMDGRYIRSEMSGEMPGMGPYSGLGITGFDNVTQKYVSVWIDNHSTGIMRGEGEVSADGKTTTWKFKSHCPISNKEETMREVETITGPNTKKLEMYGPDPKSGKEFKMMSIEFTRK